MAVAEFNSELRYLDELVVVEHHNWLPAHVHGEHISVPAQAA
jgi:hypothetical protein